MESRDAVTHLLIDGDGTALQGEPIAGYFCLSAGSVGRETVPAAMACRAPNPVPAIRMGRFAIDEAIPGVWMGS